MHVLFPSRAACIAIALTGVLLGGCAYKNPLMDGPAPVATAPAAVTAPAATASAPAAALPAAAASGVQTSKEKRLLGFLTPYRPDLQQGNFISSEMVAQLKPGMTPEQVRFVLGTPLLTDIFHRDRWDYLFNHKRANGDITRSSVTLYFRDNRLERWDGGNLPTEEDYLARIAGKAPAAKRPGSLPPAAPAAPRAPSTANEPR
ncbi:MAG: outer membrane protein assembly factor BamE [Lacisediminimonas sp.]|nr:outer membrane protein assembly factor BamE [Lacisediminimonas sp.]MDO8300326.1 outer membrane protein assembly factor BamE [Lacisediminimonas sp.]MDO9215656.1 outer membrane protein assembly factor BamE [Lacisediminimonas sp.]